MKLKPETDCPYCGDTVKRFDMVWSYQMQERVCVPCDELLKRQEKKR